MKFLVNQPLVRTFGTRSSAIEGVPFQQKQKQDKGLYESRPGSAEKRALVIFLPGKDAADCT